MTLCQAPCFQHVQYKEVCQRNVYLWVTFAAYGKGGINFPPPLIIDGFSECAPRGKDDKSGLSYLEQQ